MSVRLPLRSGGTRDVLLVEGPAGWGECSPLAGYPCSPERARASADESAIRAWPPARRDTVTVNALVPALAPDEAAAVAARAVADGYRTVKVKVGDRDSVQRVTAVREAIGPSTCLRVDANGAWDVDRAVAVIARLARLDLELVEQPVESIEDMAAVRRRTVVAIAADECIRTLDDARRLVSLDAADAAVLKVQPLGGVWAALDVAGVTASAGVPVIVTSMLESSVGLAAGVALAAALPDLPYACGLGTAGMFAADVVANPLVPVGGRVPVGRVAPDQALLDRYRVAAA